MPCRKLKPRLPFESCKNSRNLLLRMAAHADAICMYCTTATPMTLAYLSHCMQKMQSHSLWTEAQAKMPLLSSITDARGHRSKQVNTYLEGISLVSVDEVWQGFRQSQCQLLLVTGCSCLLGFAALLPAGTVCRN